MHQLEFPGNRSQIAPEILKSRRRKLGVADRVLNVVVAEVRLQRPCVVPLVGQRVTAGVPQHVRVRLEAQLGLVPARSIMRANPAVVNGAPRSDVNTKGDFGSWSRWSRRRARSSSPRIGWTLGVPS